MDDSQDPKLPELAELDEEVLMSSGWSHFNLGTQRNQSQRSFKAIWLSRLSYVLVLLFFALSVIFIIIILNQVFQNQSGYTLQHEAIQKKLIQLSTMLKDDSDLKAKNLEETSQFIEQLNKTLNLFCRPCLLGWKFYKNSCYYFSMTQASWDITRTVCERKDANLVIIDSSEEQNYLMKNVDDSHRQWIGLSDKKKEGTWHWVDGTLLKQSFWNQGEPNNAGDEDCGELTSNGWNDAPCSKQNFWICEKSVFSCPPIS